MTHPATIASQAADDLVCAVGTSETLHALVARLQLSARQIGDSAVSRFSSLRQTDAEWRALSTKAPTA